MTTDWCPTACRCESACDAAERLGEALRDGEYDSDPMGWAADRAADRAERVADRRFGE